MGEQAVKAHGDPDRGEQVHHRRDEEIGRARDDLAAVARRLPADALAVDLDELGCLLFPDPTGPGRYAELARAAKGRAVALGPTCEPGETRQSWQLARLALRAVEAGAVGGDGLCEATAHLGDLLLFEGGSLAARIAAQRLAPLRSLTANADARMRETALAFLKQRGNSVEMAAALNIHPQTAGYRVARLRELLGDQLEDPDARFELEIALRSPDAGAMKHRPPPG
jgi:hypothetical protein